MDKHGQAIGGIKSQMGIMRKRLNELSEALELSQHQFAIYRDEKEREIKELRSNVFILICLNMVYYVTLLAIYCMRRYG
jgi:hypothetical protein